jgi:hypothetical protein
MEIKYATSKAVEKYEWHDTPTQCKPCHAFNMNNIGRSRECDGNIPCNHCAKTTKRGLTGAHSETQATRCAYDLEEGVRLCLTNSKRAKNQEASTRDKASGGEDTYHSSEDEDYTAESEHDSDSNNDNDSYSDDDNDDSENYEDPGYYDNSEVNDKSDANEPDANNEQQRDLQRSQYTFAFTTAAHKPKTKRTPQDTVSLKLARTLPDWPLYLNAMKLEYKSLIDSGTWKIVKRPKNRKVLTGKWVLRTKDGADGKVEKHKARYCARGFEQVYLLDYDETFATVIKDPSWRILFAFAARFGWLIYQLDFITAFLNGELSEEIFMEQPEGFEIGGPEYVLLLLKALYGLKQAPRQWYEKLTDYLLSTGWSVSEFDPSLYLHPERKLMMGVYVDDILLTGANEEIIAEAKLEMAQTFKMKDLGICSYYLGMNVEWLKDGILIHQRNYVDKIIARRNTQNLAKATTPGSVTELSGITKNQGPELRTLREEYQSMTGELLYAAMKTRPDISHTVGVLSRYASNPSQMHMDQAFRVYQYLNTTKDMGIYFPYGDTSPLTGFSDSDWATCKDSRKSTSGWIVQMGNAPLSFSSKRQRIIAQSTQEAEYVAAAELSNELVWIQRLLTEILTGLGMKDLDVGQHNTTLFIDNESARLLSKNPEHHRVAKHFGIRYHVLRQRVKDNVLHLERVASKDNTADILTKSLKTEDFEKLRSQLGMRSMKDV